jgi:hypothetical protein
MKAWFAGLSKGAQYGVAIGGVIVILGLIGAAGGSDKKDSKNTTTKDAVAATTASTTAPPATTATTPAKPKSTGLAAKVTGDTPSMDKRTRSFVATLRQCDLSAAIARGSLKSATAVQAADAVTSARDTCDNVRSELALADSQHFSDQAAIAFGAADELKSGLNAVLAYLDNPRPSKVIEARNKLDDGATQAASAYSEINKRRRVYGLKSIKP